MKAKHIKSEPHTRYVRMTVDFWYDEKTDQIHIAAPQSPDVKGFHTTVNKQKDSVRRHENLYDKLAKILKKFDKHP